MLWGIWHNAHKGNCKLLGYGIGSDQVSEVLASVQRAFPAVPLSNVTLTTDRSEHEYRAILIEQEREARLKRKG
jgi:hypothetical protein